MEKRIYGQNYLKDIRNISPEDLPRLLTSKFVMCDKSEWEETCKILNKLPKDRKQIYKILQDTKIEVAEMKHEIRKLFFMDLNN